MSEWIEHDGKGYPVAKGTKVLTKRADGRVQEWVVLHTADKNGRLPSGEISPWFWALAVAKRGSEPKGFGRRVIAYRVVDEIDESARRAERMALFNSLKDGVAPRFGEPDVLPAKRKVGAQ